MAHRPHSPAAYNALKTGWKQTVAELGGVDAAASCTRISSRGLISDYGNTASDRFPPADVILDAETIAGHPHVTAALARLQGYALTPVEPRGAGDLAVLLAELGRDVAALFADAAIALSHLALSEDERSRLTRDLDEVANAATEARALLARSRPAPPAPRKAR